MARSLSVVIVAMALGACEGPDTSPAATGITGPSAQDELITDEQEARMEREREEDARENPQDDGRATAGSGAAPLEEALGLPERRPTGAEGERDQAGGP